MRLDVKERRAYFDDGGSIVFGKCLIATGKVENLGFFLHEIIIQLFGSTPPSNINVTLRLSQSKRGGNDGYTVTRLIIRIIYTFAKKDLFFLVLQFIGSQLEV